MARTRTPGIRLDRNGGLIIDKEHRGIPIYFRLGVTTQEEAEQRLTAETHRVDALLQGNANRRPTFADCAARYLADSKEKRSLDATAWHIRLLIPYLGRLDIHQIHDATLQAFIADRVASGVKATTINRSLEGCPPQILALRASPWVSSAKGGVVRIGPACRRTIRRSLALFQASIRDASHQGPISRGRARPPPSGGGVLA
jgi:hypothetical protein